MERFLYKTFYLNDGKWEQIKQALLPVKTRRVLDETLDISTFRIACWNRKNALEPFTKIKYEIYDGKSKVLLKKMLYYVADDTVTQERFVNPVYSHSVTLVESTKILERFPCDNLTFFNSLALKNLEKVLVKLDDDWIFGPIQGGDEYHIVTPPKYYTPLSDAEEISVQAITVEMDIGPGSPSIKRVRLTTDKEERYGYNKVYLIKDSGERQQVNVGDKIKVTPNSIYTLYYEIAYTAELGIGLRECYCQYSIYTYQAVAPKKPYTISSVCERLFNLTPARDMNTAPIFKLSEKTKKAFDNIAAPEYSFSGNTIFENLLTTAKTVGCIPYLEADKADDTLWNTVSFLDLGLGTPFSLESESYSAYSEIWSSEQYCTALDTIAKNVTCGNELGSYTTEPFINGYSVARIESGLLTDETTEILTQYKITKVKSLFVNYGDSNVDITRWVYERARYDTLYDYVSSDQSKAYALYYTYGAPNIGGLLHKNKDAISPANQKYALINILSIALGRNIEELDYSNISYKIEYVALADFRALSYKQCYGKHNALINNQQGIAFDMGEYGKNLNNTVERVGLKEPVKTYVLTDFSKIPDIGQCTADGYFVSIVDAEYWHNFIKVTVVFSKNFNRLNDYVAIKSEPRFFEINEKLSLERYIVYASHIKISRSLSQTRLSWCKPIMLESIADTLKGDTALQRISAAKVTNYIGKESISTVLLPVITGAFGRSLVFLFSYKDNYSAGSQLLDAIIITEKRKVGKPFSYSSVFGDIETCDIELLSNISYPNNSGYDLPALPKETKGTPNIVLNKMFLDKNTTEQPIFTIQLPFVSESDNINIGYALCDNSIHALSPKNTHIVFLDSYLLPITMQVTGGYRLSVDWNDVIAVNSDYISLNGVVAPVDCVSWAIVDEDNRVLLGMNERLNKGDITSKLYIYNERINYET